MKLISCYIESFGKLRERRFDFERGLTVINEENGFGKTTLTVFIKAMLYGLDGYKRSTKEFSDRQKYYPFGGGRFGGNLTLEFEGEEYTVTRFFGEKSETEDTLSVTKMGRETAYLGENIGERILGLDRRSFERVAFIRSEDTEIGTTDTVNRLLGGERDGEEASFSAAVGLIDEAAKRYKKQRGAEAKISLTEAKIHASEERIRDLRAVKSALLDKYRESDRLARELEENNGKTLIAQRRGEQLALYEHCDSEARKNAERKARLSALEAEYPYGIPTEETVSELRAALSRRDTLRAKREGRALDGDGLLRLRALTRVFCEGVPTDGELFDIEEKCVEWERLGYRLEDSSRSRLGESDASLYKKFSGSVPSEEKLSELETAYSSYTRLSGEATVLGQYSSLKEKARRPINLVFFVIAALALLSGVALTFVNIAVGATVLAVGAVIAAIGMLLTPRRQSHEGQGAIDFIERREAQHREEQRINATLFEYGYNSEAGVEYNYAAFREGLKRYTELKERLEREEAERQSLIERREELSALLRTYFARFSLSSEQPRKNFSDLKSLIDIYTELSERASAGEREGASIGEELSRLESSIAAFKESYGHNPEEHARISSDVAEIKRLRLEISTSDSELEKFKRSRGLGDARPEPLGESVKALAEVRTALESEKSRLDREITHDETLVEELDRLEDECLEEKERLLEYKKTHKLLTETKRLIEMAEVSLKERYVKPLSDSFKSLSIPLGTALGEGVTLTADYELKLERGGVLRSNKHLSTGESTIAMLCYRLALMKNIYSGGEIFCILDDPFTGLDSERMARVGKLLSELSRDMQIIYFTCHDSRNIAIR